MKGKRMLVNEDTSLRTPSVYPTKFWQDTEQASDGTLITVDYVEWKKKGNNGHGGVNKVSRIKREDVSLWEALSPFYEAWKNKMEAPINGTPIDLFPSVTPNMATILKNLGFMSVEDFANSTDSDLARVGMGASSLRDKARIFIGLKNGDQKASAQIVALNERIEALEQMNKELLEAIKDQTSSDDPQEGRKRGRPRKVEE
jgi:hypothetical protein